MISIMITWGPAIRGLLAEAKQAARGRLEEIRYNFSHGDREDQAEAVEEIHAHGLTIVADLQGRKERTGLLEDSHPIPLPDGEEILLSGEVGVSSARVVAIPAHVARVLSPGQAISIEADGPPISLAITARVDDLTLQARVLQGGLLGARKGIHGVPLSGPVLTEKDKADIEFALELGICKFIPSFVMSHKDVLEVEAFLASLGADADEVEIIPKIEHESALPQLPSILSRVKRFVFGRGDYFRALSNQARLACDEKEILNLAHKMGVTAIAATGYMEDVARTGELSQSDVIDVAFAVQEGATEFLLTDQTTNARYPIEAIGALAQLLDYLEGIC